LLQDAEGQIFKRLQKSRRYKDRHGLHIDKPFFDREILAAALEPLLSLTVPAFKQAVVSFSSRGAEFFFSTLQVCVHEVQYNTYADT
jgi:hypothetical protein